MTMPGAEKLEREKDKLYLTMAELIRRMGLPESPTTRRRINGLVETAGFPRKQKTFDRYYWPACKQWLDENAGLVEERTNGTPRHR